MSENAVSLQEPITQIYRYSRSLAETLEGAQKILLVEDDVDQNLFLALRLRNQGFEVLSVFDGVQGLEKGILEEPDLIILDLNLPKMNGFKLLRRIRMNPYTYNTPIIIVTGDEDEQHVETAKNWGIDWYFRKPVKPQQLIVAITKLLDDSAGGYHHD